MKTLAETKTNLALFDGAAGSAGAQSAAASAPVETQGGGQTVSGQTKADPSKVIYGKQPPAAEEGRQEPQDADAEDRRKAYRDLITGEYKDLYTEDTQRLIDRRFAQTRKLEQQLNDNRAVIDALAQRYDVPDKDPKKLLKAMDEDSAYWQAAADEAGVDVDVYKKMKRIERENAALLEERREARARASADRTLAQWYQQAEEVKQVYPSFDLQKETGNTKFMELLKAGIPVRHAYEVTHMDEIKAGVARMTAKAAEKQIVENVRAKGARPPENGAAGLSGFTVKSDVSKLTKEDRREIARRAAMGETITF